MAYRLLMINGIGKKRVLFWAAILTVLVILLPALNAVAYRAATKRVRCPLWGTPVIGPLLIQYTQDSVRLDFKPQGDLMVPTPLLECTNCRFVLLADILTPILKESLNVLVKSPEYQREVNENTSYYMLGKIMEYWIMPAGNIAFAYLNASWQAEDDTAKYYRYLSLAQKKISEDLSMSSDSTTHRFVSYSLLNSELLRLLSRFDEARESIYVLRRNYFLDTKPYEEWIAQLVKLIAEKDHQPQTLVRSGRMTFFMNSHIDQLYYMEGWELEQAAFEIDSIYYDKFEGDARYINSFFTGAMAYLDPIRRSEQVGVFYGKYYLIVRLSPQVPDLLGRIYWYIERGDKELKQNWLDFLNAHGKVNAKLRDHAWLKQWQQSDSGRLAETSIIGSRLNAITEMEKGNIDQAWMHAGLKGKADFQIKLYRKDCYFCTLYLGLKENRALILTAKSGRGSSDRDQLMRRIDSLEYFNSFSAPLKPTHWLDALEVEYSSIQPVPSYAVVEPDGKWHVNDRGRTAAE